MRRHEHEPEVIVFFMRIAIYLRISTDEENQPYSLEAQETKLRAYIESQDDWQLVQVYKEAASGATTERSKLDRLRAAARAGRFDLVLVYRVDRFARSVRGLASLMDELDQAKVGFRSATEPFDTTTPAGRMMVQMLAVFAEFERATLIDRVINGMERKAARGEWCGGIRPYGYIIDPQTHRLAVNEDESVLVPRIFDLYVNKRWGSQDIGHYLNNRGYRTRSGKPWGHKSVLTVLRNRVYIGEIYYRGKHYPADHPKLVDPATFMAAQDLLTVRSEDLSTRASNSSDYLLSGRINCSLCGKAYIGTAAHGKVYRYRYYTCYSLVRHGKKICSAQRLPAAQLEDVVLTALLETYADSDLFNQALTAVAEHHSNQVEHYREEHAMLDDQLKDAKATVERYLDAFENGTMPESVCGPRLRDLNTRIAQLRDRQNELSELCAQPTQTTVTQRNLDSMRASIRRTINEGEPATKKALVQSLVEEVRICGPRQVQPVFRVPTSADEENPAQQDGVRMLDAPVGPRGIEPRTHGLKVRCSAS